MKSETIAIHCGYEPERTTNAVAAPVHRTMACAFGSNAVSVPRLYGMMVAANLMTVPKSSE